MFSGDVVWCWVWRFTPRPPILVLAFLMPTSPLVFVQTLRAASNPGNNAPHYSGASAREGSLAAPVRLARLREILTISSFFLERRSQLQQGQPSRRDHQFAFVFRSLLPGKSCFLARVTMKVMCKGLVIVMKKVLPNLPRIPSE
jgi:hypothetical protein